MALAKEFGYARSWSRLGRDFAYVGDVVQANLLAADASQAANRVMSVVTGRSITLLELPSGLNEVVACVEPRFAPARADDLHDSTADITLARTLLDYTPNVPLIDGLLQSIDYYRRVVAK